MTTSVNPQLQAAGRVWAVSDWNCWVLLLLGSQQLTDWPWSRTHWPPLGEAGMSQQCCLWPRGLVNQWLRSGWWHKHQLLTSFSLAAITQHLGKNQVTTSNSLWPWAEWGRVKTLPGSLGSCAHGNGAGGNKQTKPRAHSHWVGKENVPRSPRSQSFCFQNTTSGKREQNPNQQTKQLYSLIKFKARLKCELI